MKQSLLFTKTRKQAPKEEASISAQLLIRAGFIDKLTSGIYSYLPMGLKVLNKIQDIVREEMDAIKAQEILMPALTPKENWETTGRWKDPGPETMFQLRGRGDKEYGLAWTHEEIVTPLVKKFASSYKDFPVAVYQIQDKFRNEPRAKSGLLRGREFSMKDLYSFHKNEDDLNNYYETVKQAYQKIYKRIDMDAKIVEASGGSFSKYSHEFQVFTPAGEDTVIYCPKCEFAQNSEICKLHDNDICPACNNSKVNTAKAIEVGNIFKLKTRYTEAFNLKYVDEDNQEKPVLMGCYGIGPSRMMGAYVEVHNDKDGIIWTPSIAPFRVHLISIEKEVAKQAEKIYNRLLKNGIDVLWDNREISAGIKFADADLIGIPYRLVISKKTKDKLELKERKKAKTNLISFDKLVKTIT